jgi:FKBP-type peptidyl-prolyl cis-trans isomerase (trigger factor)
MSYTYKIKSLPKSAKEATIEIKWDLISKHKDSVITRAIATVQVPGFRTGKAPRPMAEKMLNMDKIYEETVRETIPEIYKAILEKEKLNPITTPSVSLTEAKEGETWKLTMTIPLVPEVKLKDYKKYIKNEKVKMEKEKDAIAASKEAASKKEPDAQSKSDEPNAELAASSSKLEAEKPASLMLSSIFDILLKESELEVPELLTHEEVNRRLTQLLDDIKKVGLTPEQYLSSKKMTEEELQKQYFKDSEDMYKIEFIIAKIADEEKLTVAPTELENILGLAKTDEEKAIAQRNMAWYETLLRKQKVIDFLNTL